MALKWDKEINIDTIKDLADQTVGDLYLAACSATLSGKRAEKLCVEAYARLYSNRGYIASMDKTFTPIEAAKHFLVLQLSKTEQSRLDNELFSLSRDRLENQQLLDSIVTRALNRIEADMPRYAPNYSGVRGTVYVLVLVLCIIAVVLFVWLNPFAVDQQTASDDAALSVNVGPIEKIDPDIMVDVSVEPSPLDTCVRIITVRTDGPDAASITSVACAGSAGAVTAYSSNGEYYSFFADKNDTYEITLTSAAGAQLKRFITVSDIEETSALSKLSYAIVHDNETELEFFSPDSKADGYEIIRQPEHGVINEDGGTFTLVPDEHYVGHDSFAVRVAYSDGTSAEVSIPVIVHNSAPYCKSELLAVTVEHTPSGSGLAIGKLEASDPDGDALTYKLTDYEGCMPVLTSSGRYALQVKPDCVTGKDEAWFSFTVSDGVLTSEPYKVSLSLTNNTIDVFELTQTLYCYTGEGGFYTLTLPETDLDGDKLEWTVLSELANNRTADGHEVRYSIDRSAISLKLDPTLTGAATHTLTLSCSDGWATSENVVLTLNILPNPGPLADAGNVSTVEMGMLETTCELSLKETSPFYSYRIIAVNSEDGTCTTSAGWDDLMFDFTLNPGLITANISVTVEDTLTGQTSEIPYIINVV